MRPNATLQMKNCIGPEWDLNPRPAVYMTAALTNWATRPLMPVSWCQPARAISCGVLLPLIFSCSTQLTLWELRITSKLPWQIWFRLAIGHNKNCIGPEWDLNPRPDVYMTAALTNWATRPLTPENIYGIEIQIRDFRILILMEI